MNDAARQAELYGRIWKEDSNYGTAAHDVFDTVRHRIAPHMSRVLLGGEHVHVVDFGAGNGRFLYEMADQQLLTSATGVDVYSPEKGPGWLHWDQSPIWDSVARGHFAISTDTLEHLPTDKVDQSLRRIAIAAPHGFLRISLKEDRYGTERGLHLHETVWPSWRWLERILAAGIHPMSHRTYFDVYDYDEKREAALEVWY
jgi:hypothetical protein